MEKQVIGYTAKGEPIYPCEPDRIYTACFISCVKCSTAIRSMGGPMYGAQCTECYTPPPVRETWIKPGDEDKGDFATVLWNAAVGCDHDIQSPPGGGVKCTKCGGWYCF